MGTKKQADAATAPAAAAPTIDPDKAYRVTLSRVVRTGRTGATVHHPKNDNVVSGKALLAWSTEDRAAIAQIEGA